MRALLLVVTIFLCGCVRYEATREIMIPVSTTEAEWQKNLTIDGFGSNLTTYGVLTRATEPLLWGAFERRLRERGLAPEEIKRSWRVERLASWSDDRVRGLRCRISLQSHSREDAKAGADAMVQIFEELCLKIYGPQYAPFVRPEKPKPSLPQNALSSFSRLSDHNHR